MVLEQSGSGHEYMIITNVAGVYVYKKWSIGLSGVINFYRTVYCFECLIPLSQQKKWKYPLYNNYTIILYYT